ncbi:N-acetylneuraminate synthase family protein, partial [Methanoculleus sp. MH98A]|uniref:N-acetylneuraminate synthase family protein n=2 Tax=Methanoculleus sp. MH98A TaxID=1495314 RepID=UPI0004A08283
EIEYALNFILPENIPIIMYGMQNFPTDPHDVNLSKIAKLKAIYPSFVIGYADHTVYDGNGDLMIQLAYALGARIFEKHITLKKGEIRVDYQAAVDSADVLKLRTSIDTTIRVMGDQFLVKSNQSEDLYRKREKKMVYSKDLVKGTIITDTCISFKVHPVKSDFEQKDIHKIMGRALLKDVCKNELVKMNHIGDYE